MLPDKYHPDDKRWLQEQFMKLPRDLYGKVLAAYSKVYQEAFDACPIDYQKEGKARREANTRLRLFIKKTNGTAT